MNVIARGGIFLKENVYRAHLHLASKVENVGLFLGAGSSIVAGGQLIREIWSSFESKNSASVAWLRKEKLLSWYGAEEKNGINLEATLDCLTVCELELVRKDNDKTGLEALREHRNNLYRRIIDAAWLDESFWKFPAGREVNDKLRLHRVLLVKLIASRQPGQCAPNIFTVNYDLAFEWAAESLNIQVINGFQGLHRRTFAPQSFNLAFRNVQARGEARFGAYHLNLTKIHGSLSWMQDNNDIYEVSSELLSTKTQKFRDGNVGEDWPGLLIFPSGSKYMQTVGYVFGEMMRRFNEFLSKSNTCLIINGYSFADDHVNRVIASALQNPTLQLILYVPELPLHGQESFTDWSNNIKNKFVRTIVQSQLPQVTVVGCSTRAYFDRFVADLPDPAMFDDHEENIQKLLRKIDSTEFGGDVRDAW